MRAPNWLTPAVLVPGGAGSPDHRIGATSTMTTVKASDVATVTTPPHSGDAAPASPAPARDGVPGGGRAPDVTQPVVIDRNDEGLDYRRRYHGLTGVGSKVPIRDRAIPSLVYTPGVAEACLAISQDPLASFDLTCRGNTVAILTDGSDIFGGREKGPPEAALPIA